MTVLARLALAPVVLLAVPDPSGAQCPEALPFSAGASPGQCAIDGDRAVVRDRVFERVGGVWSEAATLVPSGNPVQFGHDVDISGDLVIASDPWFPPFAVGATFVFERGPSGWSEIARVRPPFSGFGEPPQVTGGSFSGSSVAIDGERLVLGAPNEGYDGLADAGIVHVFDRVGNEWQLSGWMIAGLDTLGEPIDEAQFGWDVDVEGNLVVIGSPGENVLPGGDIHGSVYVYAKRAGAWFLLERLTANDPEGFGRNRRLGTGVAIHNGRIVASSLQNGTGVTGTAFVFDRDDGGTPSNPLDDSWTQTATLRPQDPAPGPALVAEIGETVSLGDGAVALSGMDGEAYLFVETPGGWVEASDLIVTTDAAGVAIDGDGLLVGFELFEPLAHEATSATRNGSGGNPVGFTEVASARLGRQWETEVDLSLLPGATASIVVVGFGGPTAGIFLPSGEALCLGPTLLDVGLGSHSIGVPTDCAFLGLSVCAQGVAFSPTALQLQNAIDFTIGTH